MSRLAGFLNESTAKTSFYEVCSCIGIICGERFANKLRKFVDKPSGDIKPIVKEIKELAGSGGYDWNSKGVADVKAMKSAEDIDAAINLIVGMNIFMQKVGYKIVGTKPYFIHGDIKGYYKTEEKFVGKMESGKDNTADCIITSVPHSKLLSEMKDGVSPDKTLQYVTTSAGTNFIQVSLKKSISGAQLGKVTSYLRILYPDMEDISSVAKKFSNSSHTKEGDLITEGLWDKIISAGKLVFDKINSYLKSFTDSVMAMFGKVNNSHLDEFDSAMGITEARAKKTETVDKVLHNPTKAISILNAEIKKLQSMATSDTVYLNIGLIGSSSIKGEGDAYKLISNYLTIKMLQDVVMDKKKMDSSIHSIVGEMFYGGTKLPLWKVFGYFGSDQPYYYMGTLERFLDNKQSKPKKGIETLGVRISPQKGGFYTITIALLKEVNKEGKVYINCRSGTNSSSGPTFIIEGTSEKVIGLDEDLSSLI